jgi:hypothetical protein
MPAYRQSRLGGPSSRSLELGEILVHELDGHRALADGRGDPLDGALPHVAGDEDPRHARLEEVGITLEPPLRPGSEIAGYIPPREDEPVVVSAPA